MWDIQPDMREIYNVLLKSSSKVISKNTVYFTSNRMGNLFGTKKQGLTFFDIIYFIFFQFIL